MSAAYSRDDEEQLDDDDGDRKSLLHSPERGDDDDDGELSLERDEHTVARPSPPATVRALLVVPRYRFVLLAGLLFDFARIGMAFLGPYYMNDATHSPRLVQLTGAASWAFLIAGPCFGLCAPRPSPSRSGACSRHSALALTARCAAQDLRPFRQAAHRPDGGDRGGGGSSAGGDAAGQRLDAATVHVSVHGAVVDVQRAH